MAPGPSGPPAFGMSQQPSFALANGGAARNGISGGYALSLQEGDVESTWSHMKQVGGEAGKGSDLFDLLRPSTTYDQTYQMPVPGVRADMLTCMHCIIASDNLYTHDVGRPALAVACAPAPGGTGDRADATSCAGQVPRLPGHVLLRCVPRDWTCLGVGRQFLVLVALHYWVSCLICVPPGSRHRGWAAGIEGHTVRP
jgi:hypothetical protein